MSNIIFQKCIAFMVLFLFLGACCFSISGQKIYQNTIKLDNDKNSITVDKSFKPYNMQYDDPPNLLWQKTFGGVGGEYGTYVQQTSDGGYIITAKIYGPNHYDGLLIKTDSEGNELWNRTYGGPDEDIFNCIRETNDNGFIIIGYSYNSIEKIVETWLIKTDENGYLQWEKKFQSIPPEAFGDYIIVLDDGYLLMATIYPSFYGSYIWLIKTDFDGNEIWNKKIGNTLGNDFGCGSVIKTSNNDFVIVGGTYESSLKILLIKTDSNGNRLWRRTFDGDAGFNVFETDDEGYIITGGRGDDAHLIKTDKDGNMVWRKSSYIPYDYWCWASTQTSDEGYIIAGVMALLDNGFIMKFDADGNKFWEFYIGGDKRDSIACAIESDDGNYVFCGETASYSNGKYDVWLIKMSPLDNIRPVIPSKPVGPTHGKPWIDHNFSSSSYDPDGEQLYYMWDFDYYYPRTLGPYLNNETCIGSRAYPYWGEYKIKVKAIDIYGGESDWSEPISFSISRSIDKNRGFFNRFLILFL